MIVDFRKLIKVFTVLLYILIAVFAQGAVVTDA